MSPPTLDLARRDGRRESRRAAVRRADAPRARCSSTARTCPARAWSPRRRGRPRAASASLGRAVGPAPHARRAPTGDYAAGGPGSGRGGQRRAPAPPAAPRRRARPPGRDACATCRRAGRCCRWPGRRRVPRSRSSPTAAATAGGCGGSARSTTARAVGPRALATLHGARAAGRSGVGAACSSGPAAAATRRRSRSHGTRRRVCWSCCRRPPGRRATRSRPTATASRTLLPEPQRVASAPAVRRQRPSARLPDARRAGCCCPWTASAALRPHHRPRAGRDRGAGRWAATAGCCSPRRRSGRPARRPRCCAPTCESAAAWPGSGTGGFLQHGRAATRTLSVAALSAAGGEPVRRAPCGTAPGGPLSVLERPDRLLRRRRLGRSVPSGGGGGAAAARRGARLLASAGTAAGRPAVTVYRVPGGVVARVGRRRLRRVAGRRRPTPRG